MRLKLYLHIYIWVFFFIEGFLEILNISTVILNYVALASIGILLLSSIKNFKLKVPFAIILLIFSLISIISGQIINETSIISNFFFLRISILVQFFYSIIIINEKDDNTIRIIIKTIVLLFILQVFAAVIKLLTIGPMESYIGTASIREGSLSTLITLLAFSYLFGKYLFCRDYKYIIYILFFIFFNLVNEKRATIFYIPFIMTIVYLYYLSIIKASLTHKIKTGFKLSILGVLIFYALIRLNPSLNPENKIGGSFSLSYVMNYTESYNSNDINLYNNEYTSRYGATKYFISYIFSKDVKHILFGEGAGKLTNANIKTTGVEAVEHFYGIKYGGRIGFTWIFLQVGLLGLIIYSILHIKMLNFVLNHRPYTYHHLAFLGIWISIILDIFSYSMVSLNFFIINGIFFAYFSLFYRDSVHNKNFLEKY